MKVISTDIPDVLILEPRVFEDDRGFFFESYNKRELEEVAGIRVDFVQDNHSRSKKNVLRGLHYQIRQPQGKLVRAVQGEIFDVVVDIRKNSPAFGKWAGFVLSAENKHTVWVPPGFAHGFLILSEFADVCYKTTDYWAPEHERCIRWNDPSLGIDWPDSVVPKLSPKDENGIFFGEAEVFTESYLEVHN